MVSLNYTDKQQNRHCCRVMPAPGDAILGRVVVVCSPPKQTQPAKVLLQLEGERDMQGQTGGACMNLPSAAGREGKMTGFTGGSERMACRQKKFTGSSCSVYLQQ